MPHQPVARRQRPHDTIIRLATTALAALTAVFGLLGATTLPAQADTTIRGCTVVSNPTKTHHTNCAGADLSATTLSGVDLTYAVLNHVDLAATNLSNATLAHAELSGADLSAANLTGATATDAFLDHANFDNTNLRGANLSGSSINDVDLSDDILTGANLSGATLLNTNLTSAHLEHAQLNGAGLAFADFTDADLTGADFTDADLNMTTFGGPPALPANQTVPATSSAGAAVTWSAPDEPLGLRIACQPASGSTFPIGTTTVHCTLSTSQGSGGTGTFTVAVTPLPLTVTVASSSEPVLVGGKVSYTATVSPTATGAVTFTDAGNPIAGCVKTPVGSSGHATCTTSYAAVGSHAIIATYTGSSTGTVSSAALTQKVTYGQKLLSFSAGTGRYSLVAVGLRLTDAAGHNRSGRDVALHAVAIDGGSLGLVLGAQNNNFPYQAWAHSYTFVAIQTRGLSHGRHTLTYTAANDPVTHTVTFTTR